MSLPREPPAPMRRMLRREVDMVMLGVAGWVRWGFQREVMRRG